MRTAGPRFHLAQLNVMRLLAPLDDAMMADFVAALDPTNALAERTPGFVWRLKSDEGDATAIRVFDDDSILVNFSVWRSWQELWDFVYASQHLDVMRRRRQWAARIGPASLVLWWIPTGTLPTLDEGVSRLTHLREHGPTPTAFTFRESFPQPEPPLTGSNGHSPARYRDDEARREPAAGCGSGPSLPSQPFVR